MFNKTRILVTLSIVLTLLSRGSPAFSQNVSPVVVASIGADTTIGNTNISWTVGESVIQTITVGSTHLVSQGFQQPEYDITVGIVDGQLPENIKVFPNPTPGLVTIQIEDEQYYNATVYDLTGRLVMEAQNFSGTKQIDLSHIAAGKYVLRLLQGKNSYTFSVIKVLN